MSDVSSSNLAIIESNVRGRNLAMALFSLPLLLIVSTAVGLPFILLGLFSIPVAVLTTVVAELLVIFIGLKYTGALSDWRQTLRLQNFTWKSSFIGVAAGALLWLILQGLAMGLSALGVDISSSETSTTLSSLSGFWRVLVFFAFVPVVIPFIEELFFRGAVLSFAMRGISGKKAAVWGIILSSVVFGMVHFQGFSSATDVFIVVWTGVIGAVNAIFALKCKSIYPAFFIHFTYNGITVLLSALM